jgi:hypothetical protein
MSVAHALSHFSRNQSFLVDGMPKYYKGELGLALERLSA